MHGVDAVERLAGTGAVKTVLADFGEQQFGIVVALAGLPGEFAGPRQQPRDRRDGIGVEQREFERALHVPLEQLIGQQEDDTLVVAFGIEPGNLRAGRRRGELRLHCIRDRIHWICRVPPTEGVVRQN